MQSNFEVTKASQNVDGVFPHSTNQRAFTFAGILTQNVDPHCTNQRAFTFSSILTQNVDPHCTTQRAFTFSSILTQNVDPHCTTRRAFTFSGILSGTQEGLSTPPQDLSVIEEEMASSIDDDEPNSNTDHPHMRDTGHNFQEILKVEVTASTCKEVGFFPTGQNFFAVRESLSHFLDEEHKKCDRQESDHQRQCVLMRKRLQNLRGRIAAVNQRLDTVLLKDYGGKKFANIPFTSDEQSERKSESGESEIEVNEDLLSVRPFSEASAVVRRNLEHFGGLLTSVNAENERWERWRGAMADLYEEKTRVLLSDMPVTEMTDTVAVADPSSPSGMKTVEGGGDVLKDNEVNAKMRQLQRLTKSANRKLGQIRRLTRNNNHDLISGEH